MSPAPTQYPLWIAAFVAACGVCLIALGLVRPAPAPGGDQHSRAPSEQLLERHQRALAGLRNAGVIGNIAVADFSDGLGISVTHHVEKGSVVMRIPEFMTLDAGRKRSCTHEIQEPATLDCQIEQAVASAVSAKETTTLTGLIVLLVMERRRGSSSELQEDATTGVLATFPKLPWQRENGLFSIDEEEFRIFGTGTSMAGWRESALKAVSAAHDFIIDNLPHLEGVEMDEVRWAYLMLQSHAQWAEEEPPSGLELPPSVLFLLPLFLARPTPEWQHGVELHHNKEAAVYEVVATHVMRPGDELHYVDRRLSDASLLSFQGLWLTGRHRMRLTLNVSAARRDPAALPVLQKHGCAAQPLHLYVMQQKSVDAQFMSCMRLLALSANATRLQRAEKKGWLNRWPTTGMVDQKTEATATELGINALQQVLSRLGSSSAQMRQRFGADTAAARPTVHVREAETMIVVGLLKSMKELQLVSSSEYLFEALKEDGGKDSRARGIAPARGRG